MTFARSSAFIAQLFGRAPGARPLVHAATIGGLVALGLAGSAQAAVVTSAVSNQLIPVTTAGVYINVVTGAVSASPAAAVGWDINPWGTGNLFIYGATAANGAVLTAVGGTVANLALGTVVGPTSPAFGNNSVTATGAGAWTLNSTDYFGFRFLGEDAAVHYGYASVIVGSAFNAPTRMIGNIWYESDVNTAITVGGSAVSVPESSNVAMLLAGGAALAAVSLRRRRQDNA